MHASNECCHSNYQQNIEKALSHRLFRMLLDEVDSMYSDLLYKRARWLSRGEVLKRFVVCLKEEKIF